MPTFDTVARALAFISGILNIAGGGIAAVMFIVNADPVQSLICVYLCFFGMLQTAAQSKDSRGQMSWSFCRSKFNFLSSILGLTAFLIFEGSLGLSFINDFGDGAKNALPSLCGCLTLLVAVLTPLRICCGKPGYEELGS